jgi:hypothetical protein
MMQATIILAILDGTKSHDSVRKTMCKDQFPYEGLVGSVVEDGSVRS